jgi:hypothetical protein
MDTAYGKLGLPFVPGPVGAGHGDLGVGRLGGGRLGLKALGMDHGDPSSRGPWCCSVPTST